MLDRLCHAPEPGIVAVNLRDQDGDIAPKAKVQQAVAPFAELEAAAVG
ncbi:MAG: hypothetical protein ACRCZD_06760 [Phycicoccus sp.]